MHKFVTRIASKKAAKSTAKQAVSAIGFPSLDMQRSYLWEVGFVDTTGPIKNINIIPDYAITAMIPNVNQGVVSKYYMGAKYYYTSRNESSNTFRMTFWDNQNMDVYEFFRNWMNAGQAGKHNSYKADPKEYQKKIIIKMKDTTDMLNKRSFIFDGAYPTEISPVTLSYGESNHVQIEVAFQFQIQRMGPVASLIDQISLI